MHAMYGPAGIIVLPDGSRLFAGSDRGDFEEGLPQGSPESSLAFCVLIQEAVQELHEALAGGGGGATFIMDNGYCYGRPEEVLPAIRRFADRLTDLGLHLQFGKCSFYSPRTLQGAVLRDLDALGISRGGVMRTPEGAEATQREIHITQPFLPGITVGGVPLGHEAFIRQYMSTLTAGFVSYIRSTIHQLQPASSARTHQAEALGRVRSKPTARDLGVVPSLQPRVPPWVCPGESEHEGIETSSRCCLPLGRDGVLHPVLRGHRLGRVAKQARRPRDIHHAIDLLPKKGPCIRKGVAQVRVRGEESRHAQVGRVEVEGPGAKAMRELREEAWPCDAIRHPGVEEALARSTEGGAEGGGGERQARADPTASTPDRQTDAQTELL
jgi:hypothetical protein